MYAGTELEQRPWSDAQRQQFVRDGYIRVNNAFSPEIAAEARAILWRDTGCDPDDPSTWVRPVIRLNDYNQAPFRAAANTPVLWAAFDELAGPGRWIPRESLGSFPIRFPHADDPKDTGWHVDTSFPPEEPVESYFEWRVNVTSRGRALLMLFLFSDVTGRDAPTRIRLGSHLRIARRLALAGAAGMSGKELAAELEELTGGLPETVATGPAGTVYLCHPFLVHAAQPHCGASPRFLAQPPLHPRVPFELQRTDSAYSLVEQAIRLALSEETRQSHEAC
jgi:hypothetical protein